MYTKAEIFNLALSALLLDRQIVDADEDKTTEAKVLRKFWTPALKQTIQDLDLDRLTETKVLELYKENPNDLWAFAYKYPNNCATIRRIVSCVREDTRQTKIDLRTGVLDGISVIYTNEYQASIEYIPSDIPLHAFSANAGLALAYRLAYLATPLVAGKGAQKIRQEILQLYMMYKQDAQEHDRMENMNFESDIVASEYVAERLS